MATECSLSSRTSRRFRRGLVSRRTELRQDFARVAQRLIARFCSRELRSDRLPLPAGHETPSRHPADGIR
jgi:hypothetical protein